MSWSIKSTENCLQLGLQKVYRSSIYRGLSCSCTGTAVFLQARAAKDELRQSTKPWLLCRIKTWALHPLRPAPACQRSSVAEIWYVWPPFLVLWLLLLLVPPTSGLVPTLQTSAHANLLISTTYEQVLCIQMLPKCSFFLFNTLTVSWPNDHTIHTVRLRPIAGIRSRKFMSIPA